MVQYGVKKCVWVEDLIFFCLNAYTACDHAMGRGHGVSCR